MSKPESTDQVTHVYDDIQEMDNPLPRWWLLTFFGTIVFAAGYFYYYETFKVGLTPDDELAADMARIQKNKGGPVATPEQLLAMSTDPKALQDGGATFQQLCAACHGDQGEGKIGPNLTDRYWLHGGSPDRILQTVSIGVTDKGMPAWATSLGPRKTQLVTAYVLSLRGKNLPGKAPQGQEETETARQ